MAITKYKLKNILHYDTETGIFTWKIDSGPICDGYKAGSCNWNGYIEIRINGKSYLAHRLVWLYVNGYLPKHQIDHINGIRNDNRICNLREATRAENQQNRGKREDNTSGYIGVSLNKKTQRWAAYITVNHKRKHLGYFNTPELAYAAYLKAKNELHTFNSIVRNGE